MEKDGIGGRASEVGERSAAKEGICVVRSPALNGAHIGQCTNDTLEKVIPRDFQITSFFIDRTKRAGHSTSKNGGNTRDVLYRMQG